jgi:hypothetical protein
MRSSAARAAEWAAFKPAVLLRIMAVVGTTTAVAAVGTERALVLH